MAEQGERGQQGDHGQHGDVGPIGHTGLTGDTGAQGEQGRRGLRGETPGGALRLTDRRLLVLYIVLVAALLLVLYRTEMNRHNGEQTCHDLKSVVADLNRGGALLEVPTCKGT